ncbi:hypothetical protein [Comamonas thiooxydans]|uniref:hypothetical protein n=1 Tax=Comamonas thiooxydans TaxID=363952 RepID=UPI001185C7C9|nr:hypothetical protein [Comamonas thiooxydans]
MGQAKARGSIENRIATAHTRQLDEEPINIPCKTCKKALNAFSLLRHSPAGAAWQKTCECGAVTTAVVQAKNSNMARAFKSTLGMMDAITGGGKRVGVSFLEKTVDTIETGLVRF